MAHSTSRGGRFPVGDYAVGNQIGSGSFYTVWHARHRVHGTEVAIKEIVTARLNSKLQDSLKSEIVILQKINHPNIIRLHDMIEESGKIYIILEYCRGGDLSVYIQKRQGKIPEATAKHFMQQLASGLKVLRENNLIHRDLKPQNLLLSANDEKSILKIADFGFARSLQPRGLAETLCGSPLYMAPEIMQLQKYDAKADLWSVGTILYQLVVGKTPYTGSNRIQLLQNIMKTELQFPPDIKDISPLCIDLCRKLLRRNPVERLTFEEFFNHPFLCQRLPEEMPRNMTPLRVIDGFPLDQENPARNAEKRSQQEDCLPFSLDDDFSDVSRRRDMTSDYRSMSHKREIKELNFRRSKLPEEKVKESLKTWDSEVGKSQSKVVDSLELIDQDYVLVSNPPLDVSSMLGGTCNKVSNLQQQSKCGSPLKVYGSGNHPSTSARMAILGGRVNNQLEISESCGYAIGTSQGGMDPRFSWVSGSSSEILPISRNHALCTLQNPYINGSATVELHDRVEDRHVNIFGEEDYCITSTCSLSGWEDYPRFGDVLGSFTGIPYRNNTPSTFQNPNAYGSALEVDCSLINQQIAEDRSVKHKFGVTHFLSSDPSPHYNSTPDLGDTVLDPTFGQIWGPLNNMKFRMVPLYTHQNTSINELPLPDGRLAYENKGEGRNGKHNLGDHYFLSTEPTSTSNVVQVEDDHSEDIDFSDAILKYINQILMEEDMEDKVYMLQESLELQAKEQSLYEALGKTEPKPSYHCQDLESANEPLSVSRCSMVHDATGSNGSYRGWINGSDDYDAASAFIVRHPPNNIPDGFLGYSVAPLPAPDESKSVWNFRKGVEEASKFLPAANKLFNFSDNAILEEAEEPVLEMEKKEGGGDSSSNLLRGRKNPYNGDVDLEEERSVKQAAIYAEPILRSEQFDIVLLHSMGKGAAALGAYRETLQAEKSKILQQKKGSSGRKGHGGKKQNGKKKKEVVDLRTLLVRCAQAAAADDHRAASDLLKMIRQHSSPFGDGNQRLAHCFADGLEARIAGTGSQIYKSLVNKRTLAVDFLKAYHLYLASCPFRKISIFCANKTILIRAKAAMRVHIIDFGILYGFQWPTLIQHFAGREGGPPKLKITGIEFPQSGFRPAEQVEETGRRLAEYAKMFGVPFEYNAVAKRWDTIKPEDIKIEDGELVAVNCLYRFKNILDETTSLESPRTIVLKTIKEINPDIFVHGIVNGAYNAPFFVTRFREALFHFSSLFDKLEATVPREIPERILIEKEIFGREALNVIACEGWERVERPETYKQWQVRNLKAGFTQIPFDRNIMATAVRKVSYYHKDFVIDEDGKWLLLGWKGRTIYAMSCWQHS